MSLTQPHQALYPTAIPAADVKVGDLVSVPGIAVAEVVFVRVMPTSWHRGVEDGVPVLHIGTNVLNIARFKHELVTVLVAEPTLGEQGGER